MKNEAEIFLDTRNLFTTGFGDSICVTFRKKLVQQLKLLNHERVEIYLNEDGDIIIRRCEFQNVSKELFKKETEGQRASIPVQSSANHAATTQSDKQ